MKNHSSRIIVLFAAMAIFSAPVSARFEKEVCDKPKFSRFNPAHLEEVEPGAEFSFNGTGNVAANSVEVTVKGIKVDLQVEDKEFFYRFS
ncbi:MAG: hypothetical protein ACU826_08330, partial [Gammaproteobacteria bacterium]